MKLIKSVLIFVALASINLTSIAQIESDTLNILFVGNSYTFFGNLPQMVSIISDSTQTKLLTKQSTAPGARLSHHWRNERGLKTKKIIEKGNFDMVVFQEQSMTPIERPDSLLIYARKLSDLARANGAQTYFYGTWAREKVPQYQKIITEVYTQAARENDAGLVLVGEAWILARKLRPTAPLYHTDGSHPSALGTLLTACIMVEAFTGEVPEKLPVGFSIKDLNGERIHLMYHDPLDIALCLKVTEEFSRE